MKVKIKCQCGKEYKMAVETLKDAKKLKAKPSNIYVCNICRFRIIANSFAKGLARGYKWEK